MRTTPSLLLATETTTYTTLSEMVLAQHMQGISRAAKYLLLLLHEGDYRIPVNEEDWKKLRSRSLYRVGRELREMIWIPQDIQPPALKRGPGHWGTRGIVVLTHLDGNVWKTELREATEQEEREKRGRGKRGRGAEPCVGGSALDGSPQDATGFRTCQVGVKEGRKQQGGGRREEGGGGGGGGGGGRRARAAGESWGGYSLPHGSPCSLCDLVTRYPSIELVSEMVGIFVYPPTRCQ